MTLVITKKKEYDKKTQRASQKIWGVKDTVTQTKLLSNVTNPEARKYVRDHS